MHSFRPTTRPRTMLHVVALEDRSVPTVLAISPAADNTLYEHPTGQTSNGAGQHFFVGKTLQSSNSLRRGALKFDLSSIPAGSTINSASLSLNMSLSIAGPTPVTLHRALAGWGEGSSVAGSGGSAEGTGTAATANDVTWLYRLFSTQLWTNPGGDFASIASGSTIVDDVNSYSWSGAGVTADVQQWVNNGAANFGWILIGDESTAPSAKQFDTKENATPANRPVLTVDYNAPGPPPTVSTISSTSANGTYTTGQTINITLQFSESVTLAGGPMQVLLDSGGTATIAPFTGSTASGTYTVQTGQTSPDLTVTSLSLTSGATLTNTGGTGANLALPSSNLAANAAILVNPLPPTTVNSILVNLGATQRSRLTQISLNFSQPVNAALLTGPEVIRLTRTAATLSGTVGTIVQTAAVGANGRVIVSPSSGMVTSVTLTFDNANGTPNTAGVEKDSLADGRWQITIPYLNYSSTLNDTALRRLFGDGNNDGTVNADDFAEFGNFFGQTTSNNPFDFDNNGTINASDFAEFGNRFGTTL